MIFILKSLVNTTKRIYAVMKSPVSTTEKSKQATQIRMTDLEIAHATKLDDIGRVAASMGIAEEDLERYGHHIAKLPLRLIDEARARRSKLILVTAINPTPAGEGKTTTSVGLADGLRKIGKNAVDAAGESIAGEGGGDDPKESENTKNE